MNDLSIIKPLRPRNTGTTQPVIGWEGPFDPHPTLKAMGYPCELWLNPRALPMCGMYAAIRYMDDRTPLEPLTEYFVIRVISISACPAAPERPSAPRRA